MTTQITFDELDRDGRVVELSPDEVAALSSTGLVDVRPDLFGRWRLVPTGKVGAVRVGGLQVEVNPKERVGLTRLMFLLGYAANPGFRHGYVESTQDDGLWPALAESLARLADKATQRGVLQDYRRVDESLRTVRGRIRLSDQIARHPGQMVPIEVSYDEFTVDVPENQVLRSALRRMMAVPGLRREVLARLAHLDGRLSEVSVTPAGAPLPTWLRSRRNDHYVPALRLAELVLVNGSTEARGGGFHIAAFVVDMAKVFEDFVGTALSESLRRFPGATKTQYSSSLDIPELGTSAGIPMRLDIVHSVGKVPQLVFDAKYKVAYANDRYPNADHYQMLAYCTALSVSTAWLVYAGTGSPHRRRVRNTGIEIIEYPIDLGAAPDILLAQVDRLAVRAWSRAQALQQAG